MGISVITFNTFGTTANTSSSVLSHIKTRREAECFICDKTRLTSVLNGFKNVSVISPHWRSNFENRQRLNSEIQS